MTMLSSACRVMSLNQSTSCPGGLHVPHYSWETSANKSSRICLHDQKIRIHCFLLYPDPTGVHPTSYRLGTVIIFSRVWELGRRWTVHELYPADKSLTRPTSQCILFDGENILFDASSSSYSATALSVWPWLPSFDASLVLYIYIVITFFQLWL
jgi:hypothetical protein